MDSSTADLIAEKNGDKMYIKFGNGLDRYSIDDFSRHIPDGVGLFVVTGEAEQETVADARRRGIMIWDRTELAYQIGKAVLADLEGEEIDLVETETAVPREENYIIAEDNTFQNNMFVTSTSSEQNQEVTQPVASIKAEEAQVSELNLKSSPINIRKDKAISIARPQLGSVSDAELKFVPFWKYVYSLHSEYQFKSKMIDISGEGEGFINAVNGNSEEFTLPEIRNSVQVECEYEIRSPSTTDAEIRGDLLEKIIEEHTKDVKFGNTVGEAIISEHKRFKPMKDDITIRTELVYVPVWEVKGKRNSVEINASTAEILDNPSDSDVEFM
ncbi:hypothetical protein J2755_001501 [Methanohalophilus levihalophilus]|uniref:hypothetical protein n=1 Tax=Methanohalophilus levihalophilus TaxID=1431282 RepID=UPI001AE5DD41|nr:hypothetical protein [Methanohalophilus levihalophilus]MBP2030553.1 hypothetical protein [Methanohalophilus levihalophilus]